MDEEDEPPLLVSVEESSNLTNEIPHVKVPITIVTGECIGKYI